MRKGPRRALLGAAGLVTLLLVGGGAWLVLRDGGRTAAAPTMGSASPSASASTAPHFHLVVDLHDVRADGVQGSVRPRRLRGPAAAIRRIMTELYSIGFVDPSRWDGGRFPDLYPLFAPNARAGVRRDLADLTLGRLATRLSAVRPRRARLDVRFLLDRNDHPVAAVASMRFAGMGLTEAPTVRAPLSQDGAYVLRPVAGRWRIVSFRVHGRIPSVGAIERRVRRASLAPPVPSKDLLFVLVIGSDARPGQSVTATRSDSLHIVGVNPRMGMASVLGIPRDSFVAIPGHGTQKINSALAYGGPELTVRTVEHVSGIHIDAYVLTGFDGFTRIVNAIGGIQTTIPYPMSDRYSHAYFRKGPTRLNGREALAFSRDRHDAPGGDVGRSRNQGRLIVSALHGFRAALQRDPGALVRWTLAGARYLHTNLSLSQMAELLLSVPSVDAAHVRTDVVPGSGAMVGGQSVILLGSQAHAMFRDLRQNAVLGG